MQKIPKIIHYVWFGESKDLKTELCIESWRKYMPDFKIEEWNETNVPKGFVYLENAISLKNWSNVSNFLRLWAVKNFGGIYLDTDFEIIKKFDFLEDIDAFIGFESEEGFVNNAVFGAVPNHSFTEDCFLQLLKVYDGSEPSNLSGPILATDILKKHGLAGVHRQTVGNVEIYTRDFFHPYDPDKFFIYSCLTSNTFGIHHWAKSWIMDEIKLKNKQLIGKLNNIVGGRDTWKFYIKMLFIKFCNYFKF